MTHIHFNDAIDAFRPEPNTPLVKIDFLRDFFIGYLDAIAFTDGTADDECYEFDMHYEGDGAWEQGTFKRMIDECVAFIPAAKRVIRDHAGLHTLYCDGEPLTPYRLACDFWLTRNGHGVGFWDRRWTYKTSRTEVTLTKLGDALSALVGHGTEFPERAIFATDNNTAAYGEG